MTERAGAVGKQRRRWSWLAPVLSASWLLLGQHARAQNNVDSLEPCLERAVSSARKDGMRLARRFPAQFLLAPDSAQFYYNAPEDGCVGFLAVGRRQIQDLGLTLYSDTGEILATGQSQGAYDYARTCVKAGNSVVAHVELQEGSGEVEVLSFLTAPAVLPGLQSAMAECSGVGLPRSPSVDVGPEPIGPPLGQRLIRVEEELKELGYQPLGEAMTGSLSAMRRELRRITLPPHTCMALALVPDGDMGEVDLRLFTSEDEPQLLDRDPALGRPAIVKLCTDDSVDYIADIRTYDDGGRYLFQAFVIVPPPNSTGIAGLRPHTRIAYWETQYRLAHVGMDVVETQWVELPARGEYRAPLTLDFGPCYSVAAFASARHVLDDIDLSLTDSHGNLVANDTGPELIPLVYVCPTTNSHYAAHLRAPELARNTRALLIIARGK